MLIREIASRDALKAVLEAIKPYTKDDEAGRPWLTQAKAALTAYAVPLTAEENAYRDAAEEQYGSDEIEIDSDAVVSIGEDGAFIQAWVFIAGTEEDEDDE